MVFFQSISLMCSSYARVVSCPPSGGSEASCRPSEPNKPGARLTPHPLPFQQASFPGSSSTLYGWNPKSLDRLSSIIVPATSLKYIATIWNFQGLDHFVWYPPRVNPWRLDRPSVSGNSFHLAYAFFLNHITLKSPDLRSSLQLDHLRSSRQIKGPNATWY